MSTIEEIGTDHRSADGYVVLFNHQVLYTGVLAVPHILPSDRKIRMLKALDRLYNAVKLSDMLSMKLLGFNINPRNNTPNSRYPSVFEICFAVRNTKKCDDHITLFLEYAKQSRVLTNPIVSDMRHFTLK